MIPITFPYSKRSCDNFGFHTTRRFICLYIEAFAEKRPWKLRNWLMDFLKSLFFSQLIKTSLKKGQVMVDNLFNFSFHSLVLNDRSVLFKFMSMCMKIMISIFLFFLFQVRKHSCHSFYSIWERSWTASLHIHGKKSFLNAQTVLPILPRLDLFRSLFVFSPLLTNFYWFGLKNG